MAQLQKDNGNQCTEKPPFKEEDLVSKTDPFLQFNSWFEEGKKDTDQFMSLSTANKEGVPSCRMVGALGMSENGIKISTNCNSRKAKEFTENPFACGLFYWPDLDRQIIVQGSVEGLSEKESIEMYECIPGRDCRISLLTGDQDEVLSGYDDLEARRKETEEKYKDVDPLPRPPNLKGYILIPTRFEFYQGHCNWQADRITFTKQPDGSWMLQRLMP